MSVCFFFFNDTATTEIYTLSLHDALPIFALLYVAGIIPGGGQPIEFSVNWIDLGEGGSFPVGVYIDGLAAVMLVDRKSTRLNSSHANISYAVFCLKKKKNKY